MTWRPNLPAAVVARSNLSCALKQRSRKRRKRQAMRVVEMWGRKRAGRADPDQARRCRVQLRKIQCQVTLLPLDLDSAACHTPTLL
jgi:hypothetical protein